MRFINLLYKLLYTLVLSALTLFHACSGDSSTKVKEEILFPEGKRLSETYCVTCHQHTTPEVLDRISWEKVLMLMKKELEYDGINLEERDWLQIQQYYLYNAPSELDQPSGKSAISIKAGFEPVPSAPHFPKSFPSITSLNYDPVNEWICLGDAGGQLMILDQNGLIATHYLKNIAIQSNYNDQQRRLEVLGIGSLRPSEARTGQLLAIDEGGNQQILIDSLHRPVHFLKVYMSPENQSSYLICSFGSTEGEVNSGKLSLFVPDQGKYLEKVLKESPGAIKSAVTDYNRDGLMDIVALFAQGREALYLFINQGDYRFEERLLLEFNPVYGCSDFQLVDLNLDSYPDIILTNGDNGDSSPIFKYYHGVRILLNDGSYGFEESYFYPLNGASKVICRDFDADQDVDFVVLSMYPDLIRWKNEVLVYFENQGNNSFTPEYVEVEPSGRWILMDAGDLDADGDPDLILGANMRIQGILTPPRIQDQWTKSQKSIQLFVNQNIHN